MAQLQIKFTTKQQIYTVPDVLLSVPTNVDSTSLNKLINKLLEEEACDEYNKFIEFDFIVLGELLRISLSELLESKAISAEATLEIEYIKRAPQPQPQDALIHDDWVAGVEVANKYILTGCYDNSVHIWNTKGKHLHSLSQHSNCVRSVGWLDKSNPNKGFVTVSHDLTGILWQWDSETSDPKPTIALRGHELGIDTVAVNTVSEKLVTGGWDSNLKLWSAKLETEYDEPPQKRTKGLTTRLPLHTIKGHKETISSVVWIDNTTVSSTSMDHTIKIWDISLYGIKNEIIGQKSFLCSSWSPLNRTLLTGSADRFIRLYDPRTAEGSMCKATYVSHTQWVSALNWSPNNEFLFISGAYDNCVKMWDTRSPRAPLYDLTGHYDKVLCVDWSNNEQLVSGGADNSVHIFKSS